MGTEESCSPTRSSIVTLEQVSLGSTSGPQGPAASPQAAVRGAAAGLKARLPPIPPQSEPGQHDRGSL